MPSCVAPPAARSAAVALPCRILATSVRLVVVGLGTRHTLASYLSMQPAPATTASAGHLPTGPLGGVAAAAACTAASASTITNPFRNEIISVPLLLRARGRRPGLAGPPPRRSRRTRRDMTQDSPRALRRAWGGPRGLPVGRTTPLTGKRE